MSDSLHVILNARSYYDTQYRRYYPSTRRASEQEVLEAAAEILKRRSVLEPANFNPELIFEGVFELAKMGDLD